MNNDINMNTYTKSEIRDMVNKEIANKLVEKEELFNKVSKNINHERLTYFNYLCEIANIDGGVMVDIVRDRIKTRGIKELILRKMRSDEIIHLGGTGKSEKDKSGGDKEKDKSKIDIEI